MFKLKKKTFQGKIYLQSTVRSTCTFKGSTLMILNTSHLYLALLSCAFAVMDNTFSEKWPSFL